MPNNSNRNKQKIENKIKDVKSKIEVLKTGIKFAVKEDIEDLKYENWLTNAEVIYYLQQGYSLFADYDAKIYLKKTVQETDDQFQKRKQGLCTQLDEWLGKLANLEKELEQFKQETQAKKEKYKNPEYIEFLRLQAKFKEE